MLGRIKEAIQAMETAPSEVTTEPTGTKDELEHEVSRRNYVRAVTLAEKQDGVTTEETQRLKELALKQYLTEFRNLEGFGKLVEEWNLSRREVSEVLSDVLEEQGERAWRETYLQYDINTGKYLILGEWIKHVSGTRRWG